MDRWERKHKADLPDLVARWRAGHPDGTLRDAAEDLELWPKNPGDREVLWHVWIALKDLGDTAAQAGFPAMLAAVKLDAQQRKTGYLTALAAALAGRAGTELDGGAGSPSLVVTSTGRAPRVVVCSRGDGGRWEFRWVWGSLISAADDLDAAAGVILGTAAPARTGSAEVR
jgi:hypothetical protein